MVWVPGLASVVVETVRRSLALKLVESVVVAVLKTLNVSLSLRVFAFDLKSSNCVLRDWKAVSLSLCVV